MLNFSQLSRAQHPVTTKIFQTFPVSLDTPCPGPLGASPPHPVENQGLNLVALPCCTREIPAKEAQQVWWEKQLGMEQSHAWVCPMSPLPEEGGVAQAARTLLAGTDGWRAKKPLAAAHTKEIRIKLRSLLNYHHQFIILMSCQTRVNRPTFSCEQRWWWCSARSCPTRGAPGISAPPMAFPSVWHLCNSGMWCVLTHIRASSRSGIVF